MSDVVSRATAVHYVWGGTCDGWHLLRSGDLGVIEERVPAGAGETAHLHRRARQFFYVLSGRARMELPGRTVTLSAGEGCAVEPSTPHRLANAGGEDLRFLVVSAPHSHGDRTEVPDVGRAGAEGPPPPAIETDRLKLSRLRPEEAAAVFGYRSDPAVSRYQLWHPRSVEEVRDFVEGLERLVPGQPGEWYQLGLHLREGGELVGDAGLRVPAGGAHEVEIGLSLAPAHQGRGLGSEALRGLISWAFEALGVHRVFGSVDPRNEPSLRLLRAVGLRQEAHHRESLLHQGEWLDDVVFALLRREWEAGRGRG